MSDPSMDSGSDRDEDTLPDRRHFILSAAQWAEFQAALDAPPRDMPVMAALLRNPSVFERDAEPPVSSTGSEPASE